MIKNAIFMEMKTNRTSGKVENGVHQEQAAFKQSKNTMDFPE